MTLLRIEPRYAYCQSNSLSAESSRFDAIILYKAKVEKKKRKGQAGTQRDNKRLRGTRREEGKKEGRKKIVENGKTSDSALLEGDYVLQINSQPCNDVGQALDIVDTASSTLTLLVLRYRVLHLLRPKLGTGTNSNR
ncbi:hypothetical protein RRG08_050830 [Elysia crispata]|uniref:PDZ domain-containing protein n=1 Tax=Elysia crispata TaxID=231223 RepID=A0AAE1AEK8_9GAST|nr:hypothetical protein RRG08_050830 [Elysia crispata]